MNLEKYKSKILEIIFQKIESENCIVFLFGSYATGEAIQSSDIDLGILCKNKINPKTFIELQEDLETKVSFLRKIDLVDFSDISEKVKKEALKEIQLWHLGKNCRELLNDLKIAQQN